MNGLASVVVVGHAHAEAANAVAGGASAVVAENPVVLGVLLWPTGSF